MIPKVKRPRGRPRKQVELDEIDDDFIEKEIAKRAGRRQTQLQLDYETLRIITECAKRMAQPEECAAVLGVSHTEMNAFFQMHEEARHAWDDGIMMSKVILRSKQFKLATKNQVIAIFLGKNMLGQKDTQNLEATISKNINEMSDEELMKLAMRATDPLAKPAKTIEHDKKEGPLMVVDL